jgi:hypothetical protein
MTKKERKRRDSFHRSSNQKERENPNFQDQLAATITEVLPETTLGSKVHLFKSKLCN